jgi:hypothetical protein
MSATPGLRRCVAVHKASGNAFPLCEMRTAYEELRGCCIRRPGPTCAVRKEFLEVALDVLASAIETRSAETGNTDSARKGESAVDAESSETPND